MKQKISEDLKKAMKNRDVLRVSTLRMLISAVNNKEISLGKKEAGLSNDEIIKVVQSEVKKRKEASVEYEKAGREESAEKESAEATLLSVYLPTELSDEELNTIVSDAIHESGTAAEKDFGMVMKIVMATVKGRAAGDRVARAVREMLSK